MKFARLLLCLFVAVTLAMPPLAARAAAPPSTPADMDCPHHHAPEQQESDAKSTAPSCCPSAPFGWAVMSAANIEFLLPMVDRTSRSSPALHSFISAKDPPPPRV